MEGRTGDIIEAMRDYALDFGYSNFLMALGEAIGLLGEVEDAT